MPVIIYFKIKRTNSGQNSLMKKKTPNLNFIEIIFETHREKQK